MYKQLLVVMGLVFLSSSVLANKDHNEQINKLLAEWDNVDTPGLAIKVSQGKETLYERYFGLSNLAQKTAINKDTMFQIASVSKQFTAFAIALLVTENKLSLDDDIRTYLPELPDYQTPIKIMHLIHHTSGLRDIDDLNGLIGNGFSDYTDMDTVFKLIAKQSALNFIPGEQYDYSNSGYILLAKIVEKISGKSFREFMAKKIFEPIGMHNTLVFDNSFEVVKERATAYFSNDNASFSRDNGFSSVYGSSGIYTTLYDLDLWARNFFEHKVGNSAVFELMKTTGQLNNAELTNYAFGQELKMLNGQQAIYHGGGTGAYRTYLMRFPEQKLSITLVSNNSYSTSFILTYVHAIADLFLPHKSETQNKKTANKKTKSMPLDSINLSSYVGDYQIQPGLIFSVDIFNNKLQLNITNSDQPIPLVAVANHEFMLMDSNNGYRIMFAPDSNASQSIRYFQGDFEYAGKRVEFVEFDKHALKWHEYEGIYFSEELNTVYTIRHVDGELQALHARNLPIDLNPIQPDVFASAASFFQEARFTRTQDGTVDGLFVSGSRSKNIKFLKLSALLGD